MRVVMSDATFSGVETARLLLNDVPSPVRLRELICHRVREEVARYNANPVPRFAGLVQPVDAERTLNGYQVRQPRPLRTGKGGVAHHDPHLRSSQSALPVTTAPR